MRDDIQRRTAFASWRCALAVFGIMTLIACSAATSAGVVVPAAQSPAAKPPAGNASVLDGVYTEAQATRGQAAYTLHCGSCHQDDMSGDEYAPPLLGSWFTDRWKGLSVGDMFRAIQTTMPQGAPGTLTPREYADISSYLLWANKLPAGATELPADLEKLKSIAFAEAPPK